ncbi:MAG TPA: DUF6572 domain-containing protein [Candidatus Acidoferrum sp.]|nr:DUF6572 domain-containing protein [Candidatus Acidoferrum sp.]
MSVEQENIIDIVSLDKKTGDIILTISDHLDWSDSTKHQSFLQAKLNKYLAFVESGEILEHYPDAKGRRAVFNVVFKFKPDLEGRKFLSRARKIIETAGFGLREQLFAESYDN